MAEGSARTKLATVALVIVGFALGFAEFIVIGITPDIAEEYGISLASAGNLVGFFAISYAVSTPIIVLSTGRFRRFPLFVTFLAVFNVGNLLAIVAPTYETLLVARVLTAVVSGVLLSTVMTFINDIIPREKSARIISFVYAGFSVASVLGTPIGTLLADAFGIKAAFIAVEAVALVVSVLLLVSVPRSGSTDVSSRVRDQLVILKDRRIILVLIMKGFGMAATYVFYVYVTPILEDGVGLSVWMVSIVLFFYGAATIVSNLGSGSIAQHYGLAKMPLVFGLQALVLLLLGPSLASGNTALAVINVVLTGVFIYHMNAPLQTFLLQTSAKDYPKALTPCVCRYAHLFRPGHCYGIVPWWRGGFGSRFCVGRSSRRSVRDCCCCCRRADLAAGKPQARNRTVEKSREKSATLCAAADLGSLPCEKE